MADKGWYMAELEQAKRQVETLRRQGLSREEVARQLLLDGFRASVITKALRISGRTLGKLAIPRESFVERLRP